jgi:AcrR family transcriptional regulator
MSPAKKLNATKKEIILVATRLFLERGFSDTSVKLISDSLGISTGNLTFHYPTKEHLLAVLVEMLCDFQWRSMETALDEGSSPLMALCLELAAMTAICEENSIARDFYLSAYTHPMTLDIIRINDQKKARRLFADFCGHWQDRNFAEAETLVSGIEYATLMSTASSPDLSTRLTGASMTILKIYGVPDVPCEDCIQKVLQMDYGTIGRRVLQEFTDYVRNVSEVQLEQYLLKQ